MHKISDKFKYRPDRITDYGVIRPWAFPLTLNRENDVSIFSQLLWIQTSSNLQEMRTGIKSRTGLKFGRIRPVILELHVLQRWKRWCLQLFSVTFDRVFVKLAGNEDRHKSSNEFEFGSDRNIHFGVICPWAGIFNPRGYIHVLNYENNCIKSDFKEISLKLATNGKSDKAFLWTPKFSPLGSVCPCAGATCINHEKKCNK